MPNAHFRKKQILFKSKPKTSRSCLDQFGIALLATKKISLKKVTSTKVTTRVLDARQLAFFDAE